jgi:acetolactate synthase small subunit
MEKKSQLSVILTNTPGELSKLCDVLRAAGVNILAMSIQNAKDSVKELYNMREKTGRRIALAESYRGICGQARGGRNGSDRGKPSA